MSDEAPHYEVPKDDGEHTSVHQKINNDNPLLPYPVQSSPSLPHPSSSASSVPHSSRHGSPKHESSRHESPSNLQF